MTEALRLMRWLSLLKWRVYTRHTGALLESLVFAALMLYLAGYLAFMTGFLTSHLLSQFEVPRALVFGIIFTVVLLIWLITALVGFRFNEGYDLSKLRPYPVPFPTLCQAAMMAPFFDLTVLIPIVICVTAFLASGPSGVQVLFGLIMTLAVVVFTVLANTCLVQFMYVILPRIKFARSGTLDLIFRLGAMVVVFLLFIPMMAIFGSSSLFRPMESDFSQYWPGLLLVLAFTPTGEIGIALDALMDGRWIGMILPLLGFGVWTSALFLAFRAIVKEITQRDAGGDPVVEKVSGKDTISTLATHLGNFVSRIFGPETAALYKKDMLEFLRNPQFILLKLGGGLIAPVFIMWMWWGMTRMSFFSGESEFPTRDYFMYTGIYTALVMVIAQASLLAGNQFGTEGTSIKCVLMTPASRRNLMIAKNLFFGGLHLVDTLVLSVVATVLIPRIFTFFATFSLLGTTFLLLMSIGNMSSSIWPYYLPLRKPSWSLRTGLVPGLMSVFSLMIVGILAIIPILAVVLSAVFKNFVLAYLFMPLSIAYGLLIYSLSLKPSTRMLSENEFRVITRIGDHEEI